MLLPTEIPRKQKKLSNVKMYYNWTLFISFYLTTKTNMIVKAKSQSLACSTVKEIQQVRQRPITEIL
jgi:hypothetical protein